MSYLGQQDLYLFNEGTHARLYDRLGAHPGVENGVAGTHFAVWAPNAEAVSVIGDFCGWDKDRFPLAAIESSGIWHAFVPEVGPGAIYKFHIRSRERGYRVDKADPFGFLHQQPPNTASVVADLSYDWGDEAWMKRRKQAAALDAPMSIYEVHLGSWRRGDDNRALSYRDMAPLLAEHVKQLGFTHIELMPITEHPFYGSWGYQVTGYFAPTSRYGGPADFKFLIDYLHKQGIGVILDWVPAHFPTDEHGLAYFDGTHLFEHADPRTGYHPDWNTYIYNYGRYEVRSFLCSSANFWLEQYHIDGLRVDGVASMLYLDYSREEGEWIPNEYGGRENLPAISFLRQFNETVYREHPDIQTIAEESTAWPGVSRPTYLGGLGFGLKWDMGWMHDTLDYFSKEPVHRQYHQDQLTFRGVYAFHENFVLPLSHDEVVHGKGSLLSNMPGDTWQKLANLRLLYGYMFGTPGKKLLFMGSEIGQWREWDHETSIDWHLLDELPHRGVRNLVAELNRLYRAHPALYELDHDPSGFEWVHTEDRSNSVLVTMRKSKDASERILCVFNLTPVPRDNYRIGVDKPGRWRRLLDTDAAEYGGSGYGGPEVSEATPVRWHGRPLSIAVNMPPLAATYWIFEAD